MKSQSTLSKPSRKFKKITARGPLSVFERSIESRIKESVCKIVPSVIAINWFSPNITSKLFACNFSELNRKF